MQLVKQIKLDKTQARTKAFENKELTELTDDQSEVIRGGLYPDPIKDYKDDPAGQYGIIRP
jgi:hypothetical protein